MLTVVLLVVWSLIGGVRRAMAEGQSEVSHSLNDFFVRFVAHTKGPLLILGMVAVAWVGMVSQGDALPVVFVGVFIVLVIGFGYWRWNELKRRKEPPPVH